MGMMLISFIMTTSISQCINYKINNNFNECYKIKNIIRNTYLRNLLSYQSQKHKQRINVLKKYLFRNYDMTIYELEDNKNKINKQLYNNYYTVTYKYYNLSYYEHELIEFILNWVI